MAIVKTELPALLVSTDVDWWLRKNVCVAPLVMERQHAKLFLKSLEGAPRREG